MSIYIGDKEIKDLYVGGAIKDYPAMQGPCAEGFHVPSKDEWGTINTALTGLGISTYSGVISYLKMPLSGNRFYSDGDIMYQGEVGDYWSTSMHSDYPTYVSILRINTSSYSFNTISQRAYGLSIRPFKDTPVVPDSTWTELYTNGIYHNSTLGLISIKNGSNWITIADKNLGATVVYNNGDTLSESNCGKYYQRGNNYGFAWTGSVTTSSTQVDASTYGPGNYYSSSTFITVSSSPFDWSSVENLNLRGGVTGVIETGAAKEVYIGDTKVRPSIQPVSKTFSYTGSDQTWTVPYTQDYIITCKGAGSNTSAGGLGQGTIKLTKGTVLKIMVGQSGSSTSSGTYGFGGTSNYSSNRSGGGLSGVFTGDSAITATSSSRALVIGGGAGGGTSGRAGGAGGGTTGATGGGSNYGTAGGGGTQTGRGSGGNAGSEQFRGGNGSGTYGWGGGGGRWGGNGSAGDGSGDDDRGAGGGSGYVISTASNRVLTQGGGSTSGNHGSVTIVSVNQ